MADAPRRRCVVPRATASCAADELSFDLAFQRGHGAQMTKPPFPPCDVIVASAEDIGWLDVFANAKGRKAIDATFAGLPINWTEGKKLPSLGLPPKWCVVVLNLPAMIQQCPTHKLVELDHDPDNRIFVYGKRLAATLTIADCRVITHDATGEHLFVLQTSH